MPQTDCVTDIVTLADYIYPAIQKQYVAILTHEADVITAGDLEAIHQMRVSLRRLRSLIQAFIPMLDLPRVMGNKPIGRIAKVLGKVRDLDVLQETCQTYQPDLPDAEQAYLAEAISKIGKRRRKAILKAQIMLEEKDYQYLKLAINNWLNNPQYTPTINEPINSILPDLLLSSIGQLFLNPGWWIDINLDSDIQPASAFSKSLSVHGTTFHNLRKQVKAIRYLLELFPDRYSIEYEGYLKDFKQIHQLFGNIQDSTVLEEFIQRLFGKHAQIKLPNMYSQIEQNNYLNWQKWQPIQDRYQSPIFRQKFQLFLIQDIISVSC